MLEMTKELLAIISTVSGILVTGIPMLIGFLRKAKQLIKERNLREITELIPILIKEAERYLNYTGEEKKAYVKSKLALHTVNKKIRYDEAKIDTIIDETVKLTKEINSRDKDKKNQINAVLPLL